MRAPRTNYASEVTVKTKVIRWLLLGVLYWPASAWGVYDLPADRRTAWLAGLDAEGGIPVYAVKKDAVVDYGADNTGVIDATAAIQNCVNGVAKPGACLLPAGLYRLTGTVNMPARAVLRGTGPSSTIVNMSASAGFAFVGGSKTNMGTPIPMLSGYAKTSTALTLSSVSGLAVNDWIAIYENNPTGLVDTKGCGWCGDDSGSGTHVIQQFAQITAINGAVITINRPMYFSYDSTLSPSVRKVQFGVFMSGLEDLQLNRTQAPTGGSIVESFFARHCWLKNIETNRGGNNNGEGHVLLRFSHGWEIRDSYLHDGYGFGSGQNYGIHIMFWNSDHKIENNILYSLRHGVNFEGGGSGTVVLYNYFDSNVESEDTGFLNADLNPNHGAHPMMQLLEGNSSAKLVWDYTWGSSSHNTAFRNHVRVQRTTPSVSWGRWGIDVQSFNRFINLVGNVVGLPTWTTGTVLANGSCSPSQPVAFRFGCSAQPGSYTDSQSRSTAILHGNYDYITRGVAAWDGGSDHVLRSSLYYAAKPAFFGSCAWPPFGPDMTPLIGILPARNRFEGGTSCPTESSPPAAPTNLLLSQ
jgi:hypothetical protein